MSYSERFGKRKWVRFWKQTPDDILEALANAENFNFDPLLLERISELEEKVKKTEEGVLHSRFYSRKQRRENIVLKTYLREHGINPDEILSHFRSSIEDPTASDSLELQLAEWVERCVRQGGNPRRGPK